jgi:class 3 adenylate cyclase
METHGEPARIHVSAPTRVLLGDRCRFADRGAVVIKGKGAMSTFFPLGRP